jgi:phage-related protein (TIGR01555 family)
MGFMHLLRLDGWINELTGLGIPGLDKAANAVHHRTARNADQYWEDLYHDDAMARRVCEKVPNEMTRAGFELSMGDEEHAHDIATAILHTLRDLAAIGHIKDGMTWERVHGGGAVFLGIDDGESDPAQPLNESRIRRITHLAAIDKSRLNAKTWYPGTHPKAGWPETYWLQPLDGNTAIAQIVIHESRLLIFGGGRVTHRRRVQLQGWGHSVLESVHEILADYNMSWRGLTHMLQSANQDVWVFKGFLAAMTSGADALKEYFQRRLSLSTMTMGPNRPVVLDADGERYERHASEFTGVPDTIREMCQRVAAACDMPMTILFGMSPAGLNATGESDLQWWYESVAAMQTERLEPKLRRLITLLMLAKEGPTQGRLVEAWEIKFKPLKQLTLLDVATLRKTVAETDHLYITDQVVLPEEVALARHRPEGWSMDTKIDLDARKKILDAELERAIDQAENPPEPPPGPAAPGDDPNAPPAPTPSQQPPPAQRRAA